MLLLILLFSVLITSIASQNPNFQLHSNGVTVLCPNAVFGETGVLKGVLYTKRERKDITVENAENSCTSGITDMTEFFEFQHTFDAHISHWDTSQVTSMAWMFYQAYEFNQPLSDWDTSNVVTTEGMFQDARKFNQPIENWDTSRVTSMRVMFSNAWKFNQHIGNWNTGKVSSMASMFYRAYKFNQDLSRWCVKNIAIAPTQFNTNAPLSTVKLPHWGQCPTDNPNFYLMENGLTVNCDKASIGESGVVADTLFTKREKNQINQQNAASTCTSGITDMSQMFYNAYYFNADISHWDTSQVTSMYQMFGRAYAFNQPIGNWDTSKVTTMAAIFSQAYAFNQPIGNWDTSQVTTMQSMFYYASKFNQPIGDWDTSQVTTMNYMFYYASKFNQPIGNWDTGRVSTMYFTFYYAQKFNQPIGHWDTSRVYHMNYMFYGAFQFSQDLSWWCVKNIGSMPYLFSSSLSANQRPSWGTCPVRNSNFYLMKNGVTINCDEASIGEKGLVNGISYTKRTKSQITEANSASSCTSGITDMSNMFSGSTSFDADLSHWDVSKVTSMAWMFYNAVVFNQDISNWDTSHVISMRGMFSNAKKFNQNIGNWETERVSSMNSMFYRASEFNQDLSRWCVKNFLNEPDNFSAEGKLAHDNYPRWGKCPTANLDFRLMENGVTVDCDKASNGDSGAVNGILYVKRSKHQITEQNAATSCTSGITDMSSMFLGSSNFNSDISHWDTSKVTSMACMFYGASQFKQSLTSWDLNNVQNLNYMFFGSGVNSWKSSNSFSSLQTARLMFDGPKLSEESTLASKLKKLSSCKNEKACQFTVNNDLCKFADLSDTCLEKCNFGYSGISGLPAPFFGDKDSHPWSKMYHRDEPKWIWGDSTNNNDGKFVSVHTHLSNNGSESTKIKMDVILDNYGDVTLDGEYIRAGIIGSATIIFSIAPGNHILSIVAANFEYDNIDMNNQFGVFAAIYKHSSGALIEYTGTHWFTGKQLETVCCPENSLCIGTKVICQKGSQINGQSCQLCEPGTFKDTAGNHQCTSCPLKTYQPNTGQTFCLDCPKNAICSKTGFSCMSGYRKVGDECLEDQANGGDTYFDESSAGEATQRNVIIITTCLSFAGLAAAIFVVYKKRQGFRTSSNDSISSSMDFQAAFRQHGSNAQLNLKEYMNGNFSNLLNTVTVNSEFSIPIFLKLEKSEDFLTGSNIESGGSAIIQQCLPKSRDLIQRAANSRLIFKNMGPSINYMKEKQQKSFFQEIGIMWMLRNDSRFADVLGYTEAPAGIIMKHYEAGDLKRYIHGKSVFNSSIPYNLANISTMMVDLGFVVKYMHDHDIAHCDLKPANILLEFDDKIGNLRPVVTDFGISRFLSDKTPRAESFEFVNVNGISLVYSAPESIKCMRSRKTIVSPAIVKASDIYSLSVLFFEMLNRLRPWINCEPI